MRPGHLIVLLAAGVFAACAPSGSGGGGFAIAPSSSASVTSSTVPAPVGSAAVGSVVTAATVAQTVSAAYPTFLELARRHAPLYRFNAYVPGTDDSPQNRSEDFFPMSV